MNVSRIIGSAVLATIFAAILLPALWRTLFSERYNYQDDHVFVMKRVFESLFDDPDHYWATCDIRKNCEDTISRFCQSEPAKIVPTFEYEGFWHFQFQCNAA